MTNTAQHNSEITIIEAPKGTDLFLDEVSCPKCGRKDKHAYESVSVSRVQHDAECSCPQREPIDPRDAARCYCSECTHEWILKRHKDDIRSRKLRFGIIKSSEALDLILEEAADFRLKTMQTIQELSSFINDSENGINQEELMRLRIAKNLAMLDELYYLRRHLRDIIYETKDKCT